MTTKIDHAKILIEELRDQGAHYQAIRAYDKDNELSAAVFVVHGQPETQVIFEAFEDIVNKWEDVTE